MAKDSRIIFSGAFIALSYFKPKRFNLRQSTISNDILKSKVALEAK